MSFFRDFKKFLKDKLIAAFLCLFSLLSSFDSAFAAETSTNPYLGSWVFVGFVYEGTVQPPRDARLLLEFTFNADGTSRLYWTRTEGHSFCERKAIYIIRDGFLLEEINWVNPENEMSCAEDPDMKLGRRTETAVRINDKGQFELDLYLGDKPLIYLFDKK